MSLLGWLVVVAAISALSLGAEQPTRHISAYIGEVHGDDTRWLILPSEPNTTSALDTILFNYPDDTMPPFPSGDSLIQRLQRWFLIPNKAAITPFTSGSGASGFPSPELSNCKRFYSCLFFVMNQYVVGASAASLGDVDLQTCVAANGIPLIQCKIYLRSIFDLQGQSTTCLNSQYDLNPMTWN